MLFGALLTDTGQLFCDQKPQETAEALVLPAEFEALYASLNAALDALYRYIDPRLARPDGAEVFPGVQPTTVVSPFTGQACQRMLETVCGIKEVLGSTADILPTPDAELDVNATTTYTVIQWLKAIYYKVK